MNTDLFVVIESEPKELLLLHNMDGVCVAMGGNGRGGGKNCIVCLNCNWNVCYCMSAY